MKRLLPFILFISTVASSQTNQVQRYDNFAATTVSASGIGNITQVIANATITVFNQPAAGVSCAGGGCVAATTYTSRTGLTACGGGLPLTRPTATTCLATADASGNFGFWAPAGSYQYCIATTTFTTQCFNAVLGSGSTNVIYADQLTGTDACAKINAAFALLPAIGGVVDARAFQGAQACASNPLAAITKSGQVLLGNATYQTTVSWTLPTKVQLVGSGRGDSSSNGTVIQAVAGFPASTPVVQFAASAVGTRVTNVTVDCNNQTGAIGVQNLQAQEESGFSYGIIRDCPGGDLDVETTVAQNSGAWDNLELLQTVLCTNCGASSFPAKFLSSTPSRGLHLSTINVTGVGTPPTALVVVSANAISLEDLNIENASAADGILLSSLGSGANGVVLKNIACFTLTNCIHISSLQTPGSIVALGISSTGSVTNLIKDDLTSRTITAASQPSGKLGWYMLGDGSLGANSPVFTDALAVTNTIRLGQAATSQKAETGAADTNVLTLTPPASVGTYRVCFVASVSSATAGVISWTLSWTDSNGNAQANIAQDLFQDGTAAPATTFTTSAAGNYHFCRELDINNAAASVIVKWVGGGTTAAKVSASIERLL